MQILEMPLGDTGKSIPLTMPDVSDGPKFWGLSAEADFLNTPTMLSMLDEMYDRYVAPHTAMTSDELFVLLGTRKDLWNIPKVDDKLWDWGN